ncbi:restriction endonuclease subunit S [Labilibaculum sp.]|uniref:restriction endonuclease subunit S n=1 Tax=Labilibaculum sp. TaxID=2060723 RepID=UPI0035688224
MREIKLKDVCSLITCGVAKRPEYVKEGIPFLSSKNVKENRFILSGYNNVSLETHLELTKNNKPEKGDILYTRVGSFGEAAVVDFDFDFSVFVSLTLIKPDTDIVDGRYLMWYLNSPKVRSIAVNSTKGIGVQNLNVSTVREYKIPLPPLPEQKRIAAILDEADRLRQKDKQLIEKYNQLSQSVFLDMFGDPVSNPMGWEVKTMSEVCTKITDGTHHSPEPQQTGYPYVTAKHVKPFSLEFDAKPTYVNEDAHNEIYNRCKPEFGDVLYIKDGATTGIACINTFKEPISMLSSLALLKLDANINNYFLCYWLNHEGIKNKLISEFMSGAAIQRYTLKKINSFKLMVPETAIQDLFAERVQAIEAQKLQADQSLVKSEELFNSLLQRAFKGEL